MWEWNVPMFSISVESDCSEIECHQFFDEIIDQLTSTDKYYK